MLAQVGIAIFGVAAIWLSQDPRVERRRLAPVLGLVGQPFWFYSAWIGEQWGIFALSILYTYAWGKGLHTYWFRAGGA